MSLGIAFKGPEGIVLAADSRVTLTAQIANPAGGQNMLIPATYDNATKLLQVSGQEFVGAVTYGVGALGGAEPRTAHSLLPEFEERLGTPGRLTTRAFAEQLSAFYLEQWQARMAGAPAGQDMVFLVAGYDEIQPYGTLFEIFIPTNPTPVERFANAGEFGMLFGGQRDFVDRLLQGFDESVPTHAQRILGLTDNQRDQLRDGLKATLPAAIPYPFLPLQDCVDLSILLVKTTIAFQKYLVGVRGVGGAVDVATITRTKKFTPVQTKKLTGERAERRFE